MTKRNLFAGTAAAAMMLAGASLAQAADMPAPAAMYDWSGIYIGGHVGVGALITDGTTTDAGALSDSGFLGGGQVGFNWQAGSLVFGVEGDISFVDWDDDHSDVELDVDYLASVRGRLGWAIEDCLFYVTGGVAFLEAEFSDNGDDEDEKETGGVAGAGIEMGLTENLSVKVEGLYYFFDDDDGEEFAVDNAVVARVGFNWRFNLFGGRTY